MSTRENDNVFHIVIWTESATSVDFRLGLEGALATRADATLVASAYRALFTVDYVAASDPGSAYRARVGILELPAPHAQLKHPEPIRDVETILNEIKAQIAAKLAYIEERLEA
jgi:hypothetical protein